MNRLHPSPSQRIPGLLTTGTATLVAGVATMTLGLIVALAVAPVGSAYGPPAAAAQAVTSVTIIPDTGTDITAPSGTLSGPCDAVAEDGTTSDGFAAFLSGPGVFASNPDAGQPFGVSVQFGTGGSFSKTEAFTFPFRLSFLDLAKEQGQQTVLPGDYVVTVQCTESFEQRVYQEFVGNLTFDTPTSYTVSNAPTPTITPTTTPTPTPTASPPSSPAPSPIPTPTLSLIPTTIASGGTSGTGTGRGSGSETGTSSSGGLADTGGPVKALFVTGLGLSVLGSGLMLAARRRRTG